MGTLTRLFREWFTGPDSTEFELARALFALVVLTGLAYCGYATWRSGTFNVIEFGTGMGGLLTLGGLGTAAKDMGSAKAVATAASEPS